ncbi:MAG TPA: hypothetical protein VLJ88_09775, partial [Propionibacteriaceae bacterium]|nr:hypothetical protein [Propionibacteriaceae bacterium]
SAMSLDRAIQPGLSALVAGPTACRTVSEPVESQNSKWRVSHSGEGALYEYNAGIPVPARSPDLRGLTRDPT